MIRSPEAILRALNFNGKQPQATSQQVLPNNMKLRLNITSYHDSLEKGLQGYLLTHLLIKSSEVHDPIPRSTKRTLSLVDNKGTSNNA